MKVHVRDNCAPAIQLELLFSSDNEIRSFRDNILQKVEPNTPHWPMATKVIIGIDNFLDDRRNKKVVQELNDKLSALTKDPR